VGAYVESFRRKLCWWAYISLIMQKLSGKPTWKSYVNGVAYGFLGQMAFVMW